MGEISRMFRRKLWYFKFGAKPSPESPEHGHFVGGFVYVFVAETEGVLAEKIARDAVAETHWQVVQLVAQKYGSKKICRIPEEVEHFQRAIANGRSLYFQRWERDPEDEEDDENEAPVPDVSTEPGIQIATKVSADAKTGITSTVEIFTRDGQTRLVRSTNMNGAELLVRTQTFYYSGKEVAVFIQRQEPRTETLTSLGSSWLVALDVSPSKEIERLLIFANGGGPFYNGGSPVEGFTVANGIFQLMSDSELNSYRGK